VEGYAKAVSFVSEALEHLQGGFVMAQNNWLWVEGEEYFFYTFGETYEGNYEV
jgi:hypothetical protein